MAWHNIAGTMKLLASLQHGSKGMSKGNAGKKSWCKWKTCTAAQQGRPTLGGKVECFCCGTHFSKTPPLEQLADRIYQQTPQEAAHKQPTDKDTGKGKSKGKGKGKTTSSTPRSWLCR